jgi:hypothetical protein
VDEVLQKVLTSNGDLHGVIRMFKKKTFGLLMWPPCGKVIILNFFVSAYELE